MTDRMAGTRAKQGRPPTRGKPDCGHAYLRECPLTVADWNTVFLAWLGFRQVCLHVSYQAHERAAKKEKNDGHSAG